MTPVKARKLQQMLKAANYDPQKTKYLVDGFKRGFSLQYRGDTNVKKKAPNLVLRVGSPIELWNKVMVEVKAKRYAGPYEEHELPYKNFIQSPIGLVPKDKGRKNKTNLPFILPQNRWVCQCRYTQRKYCSVKYPDFSQAIELCVKAGAQVLLCQI